MIGTFKLPIAELPKTTGDYLVRFIDYDGTILKEQYVDSGQAATAPNTPAHELLTFDEWNNDFSNITGDLDVGATYRTTSGHTYLFLSFTVPHRLTPSLYLNKSTTDVLNVYDNVSGALIGTTSASGNVMINLTFAAVGDYVIRIECAGVYTFQSYLFGQTSNYEIILKSIYIGNNITSISSYCFYFCYSLQSIVIPSGVITLVDFAFRYCYSLQSIIIPLGVTVITECLFSECYSLQSIVIPSGVIDIKENSLQNCYSLQSIVLPLTLTSLLQASFRYCSSLQSITIYSVFTVLGTNIFQGCYSLKSIIISGGMKLANDIFQGCYSLKSIIISGGMTIINTNTFHTCTSLQSIVIPSGVKTIKSGAFQNCYSLQSIVIPSGVTSIEGYSFYNCTKMQEYIFEPTTPPTLASTSAFSGIIAVCKIYVPDASVDAYKEATNWVTYATKIFPISTRPT